MALKEDARALSRMPSARERSTTLFGKRKKRGKRKKKRLGRADFFFVPFGDFLFPCPSFGGARFSAEGVVVLLLEGDFTEEVVEVEKDVVVGLPLQDAE